MKYSLIAAATFLGASAGPLVPRQANSPKNGNNLPCGATQYVDYTVQKDDGLFKITDWAHKQGYNVGVCDIGKASHLSNINVIQVGQHLTIPTNCKTTDDTSCKPPAPAPAATEKCTRGPPSDYVVESGDTLTDIAANFNITLQSLEDANAKEYPNFDKIYPGNHTKIPVCDGSSCVVIPYTIKSGDIYFQLAKDAHTTVGQIEASNPTLDKNNLPVNTVIKLPTTCKFKHEQPPKCKYCQPQ